MKKPNPFLVPENTSRTMAGGATGEPVQETTSMRGYNTVAHVHEHQMGGYTITWVGRAGKYTADRRYNHASEAESMARECGAKQIVFGAPA